MVQQIIPETRINSLRRKLKENAGWTEEELDSLSPKQWVFLDREHKLRHYKIIAEVIRVEDHCELRPKIGDKFVFTGAGMLVTEESTFPAICITALAGIFPFIYIIIDRILAGLDANEIWRDQVSCLDSNLQDGGLGRVVFKIYCEKV